ncbi:MAG: hypothetical protein ABEI57_06865 [Halapricum sp.]
MSTTTDLMLFALLLTLVAIFISNSPGGFVDDGGTFILLALPVGIIAVSVSVVRAIREE